LSSLSSWYSPFYPHPPPPSAFIPDNLYDVAVSTTVFLTRSVTAHPKVADMTGLTNGTSKGDTFLFTSESVGEGHPDKIA
jgi:hypothetical protein